MTKNSSNKKQTLHAFSPRRLLRSFSYACSGWTNTFRTEANFRFHIITAIIIIMLGIFLKISYMEWLIIVFIIGAVLTAELFNTAIEYLCDTVRDTGHLNYLATKLPRDMSAAAVLTTAISAIIIGLIIFVPKIYTFFITFF